MFQHSKQGTIDVISGDDVIDHNTIDEALELMEKLVGVGQPKLVFNMEKNPLIDSQGLNMLLDMRDQCALRGGSFKIAGPNKLCKDIMKITGVLDEIEVFDDTIAAAGSYVQ